MPPENPRPTKSDEPTDYATHVADECLKVFAAETALLPGSRAIVMITVPVPATGKTQAGIALAGYPEDEISLAITDALQHVRAMLQAHGKDLRVAFV
jgi:hypothetical protein